MNHKKMVAGRGISKVEIQIQQSKASIEALTVYWQISYKSINFSIIQQFFFKNIW